MTQSRTADLVQRNFHARSLRVRVVLSQAPLSLTVILMVAHAGAVFPEIFANPIFAAGLWMHAVILLLCFAMPWDRLPYPTFLVIPYLDFVAVGFTREGSLPYATSAGLLMLFPVFWISASGLARKTAVFSSLLGTLLIIWTPLLLDGTPVTAGQLSKPLLFPFMMAGFSFAVVSMTAHLDRQRLAVLAKDVQLRATLDASRRREQLLSAVLDAIPVGVVVVDAQGRDQLMNTTQQAFHAFAVPDDMEDPAEKDLLLFGSDRVTPLEAAERPVRRAVSGESFTNFDLWVGAGDGARAFSTTARTMKDADGNYDGAVISFHDITDMLAALAAKDDFVARVSHEFRTPLSSILGYASLIMDDGQDLPTEVTNALAVIERNAERLLDLVNDLLATKSMMFHPAPTDFAQLVAHSLAAAAPSATANAVTLHNSVEDPMPVVVDAGRIGQVLDNLISNAIKYSPDGGTVTVRAWVEGEDLLCTIQDTGMGMNNTEQAEAFTKFFRADQALKRAIPGLGLGLLITKSIVEMHGGTIDLHSAPRAGTSIRFTLPQSVYRPGALHVR
ncbi:PAS domain-containing sensor histidine kinase [Paeniglutamicibacter sp. ABSL32-1]|uniref:sensor histidine kinase n=1 Tax=Paeniglutamicibacter quisquiliarum TaxID=2849498 RepID=UPI001C2DEB69|nr:PAS domain-containing sensor histidine kinase [Paeniglutamicibacter quisquiliarum]MBV1779081.1 PAS domain-containing sensor histidine kinase [Paeniglutamicibacter quisquiliarum]